jgi:hypothetical protein
MLGWQVQYRMSIYVLKKYLYMCLLLLRKEVTTSQQGHHCYANSF